MIPFSIRLMAIMDHFRYYTQPLRSHADPLWFRRMDFMPWLEYMKEQKRLHIIKDPSVSGDLNKRLQGHPTTAGKSSRDFSKLPPVTSAGGSDIDSEDSETDFQ